MQQNLHRLGNIADLTPIALYPLASERPCGTVFDSCILASFAKLITVIFVSTYQNLKFTLFMTDIRVDLGKL